MSNRNLLYPSNDLTHAVKIMEKQFIQFHGDGFNRKSNIFYTHTGIVYNEIKQHYLNIESNVILYLVRTRTYIRARAYNRNMKIIEKDRRETKKFRKMTNSSK